MSAIGRSKIQKAALAVLCALALTFGILAGCTGKTSHFSVQAEYNEEGGAVVISEPEDESGFKKGETATVTVTPKQTHELTAFSVTVEGAEENQLSALVGGVYTFEVAGETLVKATFTLKEAPKTSHVLTLDFDAAQGSIVLTPAGTPEAGGFAFDDGAEVHFEATPAQGFELTAVKLNGSVIPATTGGGTLIVTSDMTLSAVFSAVSTDPENPDVDPDNPDVDPDSPDVDNPEPETVKVTLNVGEHGEASLSPSGEVSGNIHTYEAGTALTLTVTPDSGYTASVFVNSSPVALTEGQYAFTVNQNTAVSVSFAAPQAPVNYYLLTVDCGEHGSVKVIANDDVKVAEPPYLFEEGTELHISVESEDGYQVASFKVDGVEETLAAGDYYFTLEDDTRISATFIAECEIELQLGNNRCKPGGEPEKTKVYFFTADEAGYYRFTADNALKFAQLYADEEFDENIFAGYGESQRREFYVQLGADETFRLYFPFSDTNADDGNEVYAEGLPITIAKEADADAYALHEGGIWHALKAGAVAEFTAKEDGKYTVSTPPYGFLGRVYGTARATRGGADFLTDSELAPEVNLRAGEKLTLTLTAGGYLDVVRSGDYDAGQGGEDKPTFQNPYSEVYGVWKSGIYELEITQDSIIYRGGTTYKLTDENEVKWTKEGDVITLTFKLNYSSSYSMTSYSMNYTFVYENGVMKNIIAGEEGDEEVVYKRDTEEVEAGPYAVLYGTWTTSLAAATVKEVVITSKDDVKFDGVSVTATDWTYDETSGEITFTVDGKKWIFTPSQNPSYNKLAPENELYNPVYYKKS